MSMSLGMIIILKNGLNTIWNLNVIQTCADFRFFFSKTDLIRCSCCLSASFDSFKYSFTFSG